MISESYRHPESSTTIQSCQFDSEGGCGRSWGHPAHHHNSGTTRCDVPFMFASAVQTWLKWMFGMKISVKQAIQDPFLRCSIVVTLPQPFDSFSRVYIIDILDFNSYLLPRWICWCLWSAFNALKCLNAELKRLDSFWHLTSSSFLAFMTAGLTCSSHHCWKVMESRWVTGTSLVRSLTQAHGD